VCRVVRAPAIVRSSRPSRHSPAFLLRAIPPASLPSPPFVLHSPCRRVLAGLALGYLTPIRPASVRTTRHVMHPPIVNFPNAVTSLRGVIRIPAGLVIVVDTRLSDRSRALFRAIFSLLFGAGDAGGYVFGAACFVACYRPRRAEHRASRYILYVLSPAIFVTECEKALALV